MKNAEDDSNPPRLSRRLLQKLRRGMVLYVLVPYLSVTIIFTVFQRKLIYRPTVSGRLNIAEMGLGTGDSRDIELQTSDGHTLRGWLLNGRDREGEPLDAAPLLVYFPGNSLNRQERIADLKEVTACGYDILIFDYRGFGDSTGSPSETGLTSDARLIWQYATDELGYDEHRIVMFGESIGGAVALSLWSDENSHPPQPAALILSSTFASLPKAVAWHYPYFPFQFLLLDRWPSLGRIPHVDVPIIIFHSTEDDMVPVAHARELAEAATNSRFIEISGSGHNDIPLFQLRKELELIAGQSPK